MRICIDVSQAQYPGTGVGNYTLELSKHLSLLSSDHFLIFFGMSWGNKKLLKNLYKSVSGQKRFLPIPNSLTSLLFNQYRFLPIEIFSGSSDIFHTSDWTHPLTLSMKKITTIHDLTPIKYPEFHHSSVIKNTKIRLNLIKNDNSYIITDSLATKKDLIKHYQINENRIHVIHLAASPDFLTFSNFKRADQIEQIRKVKSKYNLDQYLLSVGTAEPRKNIGMIIESFENIVKPQFSKLDLAIAGKYGWGSDERKKDPRIKNLGFVDQADLPALYAGSKGLVYPSLYEGFGLPVLEAMTVGVPVVTSNRGSLAEVAGTNAVVVNPKDAKDIGNGMIEILNNSKKWIEKGEFQASKFSWHQTATKTMEVYESVFKS